MDWNANVPDVVGLELVPQSSGTLPEIRVDTPLKSAAMSLVSTVTETVDSAQVLLNADAANTIVLAETYTAGDEETGAAVTTTIVRPNSISDINSGGSTPSTEAPMLAIIAQDPLNPAVYATGGSSAGFMDFSGVQFPTTGLFTGRRILDVRAIVVVSDPTGKTIRCQLTEDVYSIGGYSVWRDALQPYDTVGPAIVTLTVSTGEIHPITQLPWTVADVEQFDNPGSGGKSLSILLQNNNPFSGAFDGRLYQLYIEVDHCEEHRVTVDLLTNFTGGSSGTGPRRKSYVPTKLDGTSNINKVAGGDLTLVLRQPRYGSRGQDIGTGTDVGVGGLTPSELVTAMRFSVPYILALRGVPAAISEYKDVTINSNGTVLSLGVPPGNRMLGWDLVVTGVTSVDSQSFVRVNPQVIFAPLTQEIDLANGVYRGINVPLAYTAITDVGDLTITLRRRSDDVALRSVTITQAMLAASPLDPLGNWRLVQAQFAPSPVLLSPGVQYYFDFTAGHETTPVAAGWVIPLLRAYDTHISAPGGGATYRGEIDAATADFSRHPDADLAIVVYTAPPIPSDITVTPETVTIPINDVDCGASSTCDLTGIGYNHVSWNFSTSGGFSHYELQRQDDRTDWAIIAYITDQYVLDFDDLEARLGQVSCYRIRAFNHVGVASDWSNTACNTAPVGGLGLTFTTNEEPETAVGYVDIATDATRAYQWDEANEDVERKLYGRDDVVVFKPLERRGPRFQRTMLIAAFVTQTNPGPDAFDALRDLAKAALSYVCVRDESGNRWFMSINVPEGFDRGVGDDGGDVYTATVRFVQTTTTPSQPDVVAIIS